MADKTGGIDSQAQWREKYLDALDAQEALEQTFARQQEQLHRLLVRISLAADGQDENLDQALAQARHVLRTHADNQQPTLTQLDDALHKFEQRRTQAQQDINLALTQVLQPLNNPTLPRLLKKEINHYLAQLPQRVSQISLYPALLQQLADIQRQVLASPPATGFWEKLRKKDVVVSVAREPEVSTDPGTDCSAKAADPTLMSTDINLAMVSPDAVSQDEAMTEDQLVQSIRHLVLTWLQYLEIPQELATRVQEIRTRLEQPNLTEHIFTVLERVRMLIIDTGIFANKAFATYLDNVNQELADIFQTLDGVAHYQAQQVESTHQFETSVMQQMTDLETEADEARDLDQLKDKVKSQLGNIRQALDHLHNKDQDQQQLTTQLQELAEKLKAMEAEAESTRSTLEKHRFKSLHDPLTELPNREAYSERILAEFNRWQRYQHPLSIAVCDLDHFKKINDTFGHQAGDRVLKVISRSISKRLREVDFFGRYGGEEFVAILPETDLKSAYALLEKIRSAIANTAFNYKDAPLAITLSVGITEFYPGDTVDTAFARADKALYAAKAAGRNCVIIATE